MWGLREERARELGYTVMFPTHVGIARCSGRGSGAVNHVPYACGDCASIATCWSARPICSLRMWGLRVDCHVLERTAHMFPTHVGIARRRRQPESSNAHVPYACGDCAVAGRRERLVAPCSLRMWGLRVDCPRTHAVTVMFPTHVGIARDCRRTAYRARHVPYACGDCAEALTLDARALFMFPTHVGIARISAARAHPAMHVPYACGDCASLKSDCWRSPACSLRMWGLRDGVSNCGLGRAMFPTHVGIARPDIRRDPPARDVPYACGDCAQAQAANCRAPPCSLRMWGLRVYCLSLRPQERMFPTHVGIARAQSLQGLWVGDVPYACGDCAFSSCTLPMR